MVLDEQTAAATPETTAEEFVASLNQLTDDEREAVHELVVHCDLVLAPQDVARRDKDTLKARGILARLKRFNPSAQA